MISSRSPSPKADAERNSGESGSKPAPNRFFRHEHLETTTHLSRSFYLPVLSGGVFERLLKALGSWKVLVYCMFFVRMFFEMFFLLCSERPFTTMAQSGAVCASKAIERDVSALDFVDGTQRPKGSAVAAG